VAQTNYPVSRHKSAAFLPSHSSRQTGEAQSHFGEWLPRRARKHLLLGEYSQASTQTCLTFCHSEMPVLSCVPCLKSVTWLSSEFVAGVTGGIRPPASSTVTTDACLCTPP